MKKLCTFAAMFGLVALMVLPSAAMHHEVKIADQAGIGRYLTDAEGMTLYWFAKDSVGRSACVGRCVDNWPLFHRAKVAPTDDLKAEDFDAIVREDGAMQTTFRGYPLYYFKGDAKPGDVSGNGMMDVWHVVDPDNFPPR